MKNVTKIFCVVASAISLTSCSWMDDLGRHMPVIGERCENWQCFTSSGQAQSEMKKRELAAQKAREQQAESGASGRIPINGAQAGAAQAKPAAQPAANAQPVPEKPSEPTPFDLPPDQLGNLPEPASSSE